MRQRVQLDVQAESEFSAPETATLAKEEKFIARFKARASHAAEVQSRVKKLEKIERDRAAEVRSKVAFRFPRSAALGRRRGEVR
ncbi:MAG: hypothetical protein QM756_13620 [Polyangiaceae bacterium]